MNEHGSASSLTRRKGVPRLPVGETKVTADGIYSDGQRNLKLIHVMPPILLPNHRGSRTGQRNPA